MTISMRALRRSPGTASPFRNRAGWLLAGGALVAAALAVRLRTQRSERENPPLGRFIEVDGVRLHYLERGEGPPLVLLHGNGSMLQDFAISGLIEQAARTHRVIAFDRPGYGYSERPRGKVWTPQAQAELLHRALAQLQVERPIVVAHSWACLVAVALALAHPGEVRSLVLMSGYYYPSLRFDVPLLSPPAIPLIGDLMRYTVSPLLGRLAWPAILRRIFGPGPVPVSFSEFPVWMALRPLPLRAGAAESALMVPAAFSLRSRYRELTMPIVIMAGADDRLIDTHAQSERLHRALPHSELQLVPGAGHMIQQQAPLQVLDAIEQAGRVPERAEPASARTYVFSTPERLS
jgi:pimeloyl-ACP methyl ester carboxylesterase